MSEGMSEERLAQIDASFPLSDDQWRWDTEDAIEAFGYVRELRDEVRRLRYVERDLRATIADEHSRLSQDFENEEELLRSAIEANPYPTAEEYARACRERDQTRAELAKMREELGEAPESDADRDRAVWCWARNPHGRLHCGRLAGHEGPHKRGEREWHDAKEGDDHA